MPTRPLPQAAVNSKGLGALNIHTERNLPIDLEQRFQRLKLGHLRVTTCYTLCHIVTLE